MLGQDKMLVIRSKQVFILLKMSFKLPLKMLYLFVLTEEYLC